MDIKKTIPIAHAQRHFRPFNIYTLNPENIRYVLVAGTLKQRLFLLQTRLLLSQCTLFFECMKVLAAPFTALQRCFPREMALWYYPTKPLVAWDNTSNANIVTAKNRDPAQIACRS